LGEGDWWDDLQIFWDDFSKDGRLRDLSDDTRPRPADRHRLAGVLATLGPSEETTIPFVIAWSFPNVKDYFDVVPKQREAFFGTTTPRASRTPGPPPIISSETCGPRTLDPPFSRRSLFFDAAALRPRRPLEPDVDHPDDDLPVARGQGFFGFEGCDDRSGCCPLNCAHVWNYEQSLAFLFRASSARCARPIS